MEPSFNTSFIPKKSLQANLGMGGDQYVKRRNVYGPGFFITSVIFALAVITSVGLFGYTNYVLQPSIDRKLQDLTKMRDNLNKPELLLTLEELNTRLSQTKTLVTSHVAVSELFAYLEDITLGRVQYTSLEYLSGGATSARGASKGSTEGFLKIKGKAADVTLVAVQVDQYKQSEFLHNPILLRVARDLNISPETQFDVNLTVDSRLPLYSRLLTNRQPQTPPALPEDTQPSATATTTTATSTQVLGESATSTDTVSASSSPTQ